MSRRYSLRWVLAVSVLVGAISTSASAQADPFGQTGPFFDYQPAPSFGFQPAPDLNDNSASAAAVALALQQQQDAGGVLAVKVRQPLSNPAALAVFDNFPVQYVFADFYDANRRAETANLADRLATSSMSKGAFLGNFNFYPGASTDSTRPASLGQSLSPRFTSKPTDSDYLFSGSSFSGTNRTAQPALFPGSPDFNPGALSTRAGLFMLPIQRLTNAEVGLKPDARTQPYATSGPNDNYASTPSRLEQLIPYVARFNNAGNPNLGSGGSDNFFITNAPNSKDGQLLSRGDFQAQILHYRMRGADSVLLYDPDGATGVVGYSQTQERLDVALGWTASSVANGIFDRNYGYANLSNLVGDGGFNTGDTSPRSTDLAGVVWSGVYDLPGSVNPETNQREMVLLLSNLSTTTKTVDLPDRIGLFHTFNPATEPDNYDIAAGQHRVLEFALEFSSRGQTEWVYQGDKFIGLDTNRNGTGYAIDDPVVPEPAPLGLFGGASLLLSARRARRGAANWIRKDD